MAAGRFRMAPHGPSGGSFTFQITFALTFVITFATTMGVPLVFSCFPTA
jgi:hypothetical protein